MREMKDSGIPWIGEIPKDWEVVYGKKVYLANDGGVWGEDADGVDDTIVLRSTEQDIDGRLIIEEPARRKLTNKEFESARLKDGDLIITKSSGSPSHIGKTSLITESVANLNCCYSNFIQRLRVSGNPLFYWFLLNSVVVKKQFEYLSTTTTGINNINSKTLDSLLFPIPSLAEQQRIAEFLDRKCAEVDEMIGLLEQIIEELKAYKQSVITEAVTKGLKPDAPMRDSGIEWIGQIPEHWKIEPLKYNFNRRSERNNPIITTERLSLSIDKGVTLYSEKTTNLDRFKEDFTQYQLAYPNDIVLNCMNMIVGAVGLSKYLGCVSPVYYVIYPSNCKVDSEYYSYMLNTPTIRGVYYSYGKGIYAIERGEGRINTCRLKVSYDDFGRLDIPIPPIDEQKNIVSYIKEKCANIDSLIQTKQSKIDSFKEYKKSIIYEYVTGKREVE